MRHKMRNLHLRNAHVLLTVPGWYIDVFASVLEGRRITTPIVAHIHVTFRTDTNIIVEAVVINVTPVHLKQWVEELASVSDNQSLLNLTNAFSETPISIANVEVFIVVVPGSCIQIDIRVSKCSE
jgi:hypothetical protein